MTPDNPADHFGGTWQNIGAGRVLVGVDSSDTDFATAGKTGGEKTHIIGQNELPRAVWIADTTVAGGDSKYGVNGSINSGSFWGAHTLFNDQHAANNLQPYITAYFWQRTA